MAEGRLSLEGGRFIGVDLKMVRLKTQEFARAKRKKFLALIFRERLLKMANQGNSCERKR